MPRRSKKSILAEAQDPAAPFLFDEDDLPVRNDMVKAVQEGVHRHTGARLLDNHAQVLRMVELLLAGWGLKRIAKAMHVSKWSVKAARKALVARGEMAPWKERVVEVFEDIVEVGSNSYLRDLENGLVAPGQKPFGVGIFFDKRGLALGEPTSITASVASPAAAQDLNVEKLNAWFSGLKRANAVTVNDAFTGLPQKAPENEGKEAA